MSGQFAATIFILLQCLIITVTFCRELEGHQGQIIPGIHKETLPQPIIYDTFIPLILEYQTPKWNKSEVTFNNWYTCLSEKAPYRYSCPVVFHMNQAMLNLHVDFEGLHPVTDLSGDETIQNSLNFYNSLTTSSEFCSKIQKHFSGMWSQSSNIELYLKALSYCNWDPNSAPLKPIVERSISDYNYSIRAPFTRMENNFYTTFYKDITAAENATANTTGGVVASTNLDLVASALLSNARTTLQGAILGVYYAEKNRWVHANQDCLNQVIPQSIVTKKKFKDALTNITSSSSFTEFYDLSIDPESISKYYTLPLTDCSHTSSNTFVVRILIPVVKKRRSKSLELVHIHNLPFQYNDHICEIKLTPEDSDEESLGGFYQNSPSTGAYYLYQEYSNSVISTDCRSNELCKISEYGLSSKQYNDLCLASLISKNHTGIQVHCNFFCKKRKDNGFPLVTRLHSNKYVLTGSSLAFIIQCNGLVGNQGYRMNSQIGSVMIDLPCKCQLVVHDDLILHGEGPCHDGDEESVKLKVTQIVPYHFGRAKPSLSAPTVSSNAVTDGFYYEDVSQDVLVNLADFVDIDRIEGYLKNKDGSASKTCKGNEEGAEKLTLDQSGSSSGVTSLWVVFAITTVVLFSIQIYILYLLRRYQKTSYPKDRILYRVPERPGSLESIESQQGFFSNNRN